ncbi:hypothetical protein Tco_1465748 [Tanacetum coccineum]
MTHLHSRYQGILGLAKVEFHEVLCNERPNYFACLYPSVAWFRIMSFRSWTQMVVVIVWLSLCLVLVAAEESECRRAFREQHGVVTIVRVYDLWNALPGKAYSPFGLVSMYRKYVTRHCTYRPVATFGGRS